MTIIKQIANGLGVFALLLGLVGIAGQVAQGTVLDQVFLGCFVFPEESAGRSTFCVPPGVSCEIIGTNCLIDETIYVALSRSNFVKHAYSQCKGKSSYVCLENQAAISCMSWSAYQDLSCNTLLCMGDHMVLPCTVGGPPE